MSDHGIQALKGIKALTFDVFGTVVDWRTTVQTALSTALRSKPPSPSPSAEAAAARAQALTDADIAALAQEWRDSYKRFTRGFRPGADPWKDVDAHHYDSLVQLLDEHGIAGLLGPDALRDLSLVWHRLAPWPDSAAGLRALGGGCAGAEGAEGGLGLVTASLSNGNRALLADLDAFGGLGFGVLFSAEDFGAYKTDPQVYLGAVERLGVLPGEVAMVAAHLGDLEAARQLGLRTVYVERKREEDWDVGSERYEAARGWVDLWVGVDEGGVVEVARRLGAVR
ncbi:hypothetical protein N8I77_002651 [Diaporthe amygdali]|uniref:Uncharacterized protein n=1 Tax=Phomopsis amygdali TaxID=1214568 RepID=A0AAD9W9H0_PHOAM|nr:hypothetical protein N8I77_002651 [Diaporthe amygdali]